MGVGPEWARTRCAASPPQAVLPLMKFLEVELCYMNTNLVQENFNRSAAAACPVAPHHLHLSSHPPLLPGLSIRPQGRMQPDSLKRLLQGSGRSWPHNAIHFTLG